MTARAWNEASLCTLRAADALFAASSLRWVQAWRGFGDPGLDFDRLVQAALSAGKPSAAPGGALSWPAQAAPAVVPPAPSPRPAATWPVSALLRSGQAAGAARVAPAVARTGPAHAGEQPPASTAGIGARPVPGAAQLRRRLARTSGLAHPRAAAPAWPQQTPRDTPRTAAAGRAMPPLREAPSSAVAAAGAVDGASGAQAAPPSLRLLETPSRPTPVASRLPPGHAGPRSLTSATLIPATSSAASPASAQPLREPGPRTTRLVEGLPALQGLLTAVVADSHERHAGRSAMPPRSASALAPSGPLEVASTAAQIASTAAAPPLRALPQLDAVAEDMLVDRLTDRLQERLREQALRHFGFTAGLN